MVKGAHIRVVFPPVLLKHCTTAQACDGGGRQALRGLHLRQPGLYAAGKGTHHGMIPFVTGARVWPVPTELFMHSAAERVKQAQQFFRRCVRQPHVKLRLPGGLCRLRPGV